MMGQNIKMGTCAVLIINSNPWEKFRKQCVRYMNICKQMELMDGMIDGMIDRTVDESYEE